MGFFQRLLSALGLRKHGAQANDEPGSDDASIAAGQAVDSTASDPADGASDVERDPELEAVDDCASFDFERDIARYFTAEFRIEQAWQNHPRRSQLFAEYEVRDGAHWYQVKATFERWLESPDGKAKYPTESALMQARMTTTQTVTIDELEAMIDDTRQAKG